MARACVKRGLAGSTASVEVTKRCLSISLSASPFKYVKQQLISHAGLCAWVGLVQKVFRKLRAPLCCQSRGALAHKQNTSKQLIDGNNMIEQRVYDFNNVSRVYFLRLLGESCRAEGKGIDEVG